MDIYVPIYFPILINTVLTHRYVAHWDPKVSVEDREAHISHDCRLITYQMQAV